MTASRFLQIPSFAKINWILKVLGKRTDGFHELRTVLQTIDICDTLSFEATAENKIQLIVEGRQVAQAQDNLVHRAAVLLQQAAAPGAGARIRLEKRIPVGAGLGGGSGNAAITLLALNQLWNCRLDRSRLWSLASQLGSDVPFFIEGGTVLGSGRGELLEPLPDPPQELLLIYYPGIEIRSAHAYQLGKWPPLASPDLLTKKGPNNTISSFQERVERRAPIRLLAENDFDEPVLDRFPPLQRAKKLLEEAGCERVLLCGSGSALLGLGMAGRLRQVAKDFTGGETDLAESSRGQEVEVVLSRTLSRRQYREILRQSGLEITLDFVA